MATLAEKIEVMQAFEEGKQVEFFDSWSYKWTDIESPVWNWDEYTYRIKPQDESHRTVTEIIKTITKQVVQRGFIPNDWIEITDRKVVYVDDVIEILKNNL